MNRFLRFLEARGHARIPRWWEDLMRNAKVTSRESFGFGWQDQKFDYRPTLDLNGKSIKSRITFEGQNLRLSIGEDFFAIPQDLGDDVPYASDLLSALVDPPHYYLAMYHDFGYEYPLVCWDRSSRKILVESGRVGPLVVFIVRDWVSMGDSNLTRKPHRRFRSRLLWRPRRGVQGGRRH